MFKKIFKSLGFLLSKEEKIAKARKLYSGDQKKLALEILKIEDLIPFNKKEEPEILYKRLVKVCAEHKIDFEIPN